MFQVTKRTGWEMPSRRLLSQNEYLIEPNFPASPGQSRFSGDSYTKGPIRMHLEQGEGGAEKRDVGGVERGWRGLR